MEDLISIGIIEDELVVQRNLQRYFETDPRFEIQLQKTRVEDFLEALQQDAALQPAVILLDINLPGMSGLEGIRLIHKQLPDTDIIMLTTFEESDLIFKALCAGAVAYLSKRSSLKDILEAVIIVSQGGSYMSPAIARKVVGHFAPAPLTNKSKVTHRQREIIDALVAGKSYQAVADELGISVETVRSHVKNIYKTLEVNSKTQLIRKAFDGEI